MIRKTLLSLLVLFSLLTLGATTRSLQGPFDWMVFKDDVQFLRLSGDGLSAQIVCSQLVETLGPLGERWNTGSTGSAIQDGLLQMLRNPRPRKATDKRWTVLVARSIAFRDFSYDRFRIEGLCEFEWFSRGKTLVGTMSFKADGQLPRKTVHLRVLIFPLWSPLVLFGVYPSIVGTRFAWRRVRRHRRRRKGWCLGCGYDLQGNVSGVCPECGSAMPR